jgi:Short C-terminal domain
MGRSLWALARALGGGALLSGCATMIRGTEEPLQLTSLPSGARAVIGSGQSCTTPCSIHLARNTSTVVTFEREGCETAMVSVFPTLAGAGVILGGVIDYGTGAVYNLQPNPVVANLRCASDTAGHAVPALIPPVVTTAPDSSGSQTETKLLELKSLLDKGLITTEEYEQKRALILKGM